jgi:hypothetical protein
MPVEPPRYTTACVLLKQPDKQKLDNTRCYRGALNITEAGRAICNRRIGILGVVKGIEELDLPGVLYQ